VAAVSERRVNAFVAGLYTIAREPSQEKRELMARALELGFRDVYAAVDAAKSTTNI
jgi:hypothetical protein